MASKKAQILELKGQVEALTKEVEKLKIKVFPPKGCEMRKSSGFSLTEDVEYMMETDKLNIMSLDRLRKDFNSLLSYLGIRRSCMPATTIYEKIKKPRNRK